MGKNLIDNVLLKGDTQRKLMIKKIITVVGGLLIVGLIAIQLIPVDRTNPPVVREPAWDSPTTRAYAERACFDCHSNETKWPWYSYVAPVSWQVADHVHEGRKEFNISDWPSGEGDEAAEKVQEGSMPMWQYVLMHPEANLTAAEKKEFIAGLQATFGIEGGEASESKAGRDIEQQEDED